MKCLSCGKEIDVRTKERICPKCKCEIIEQCIGAIICVIVLFIIW